MKKWILFFAVLTIAATAIAQKAVTCYTSSNFTTYTSKEGAKKSTVIKYAKPMTLCKYGEEQITFYVPLKGDVLQILNVEFVGVDTIAGRFGATYLNYQRTIMVSIYPDEIMIQFMKGDGRMVSMKNIKANVVPIEDYLNRQKNSNDW
jgi:hypothetical protein